MTYIVTTSDSGDPDDGIPQIVSEEDAQDMTADFFAAPNEPDGSSITIRRAGYMASSPAPSGFIRGNLTLIKGGRS